MTITKQETIDAGYKPFVDYFKTQSLGDSYRGSTQKRFDDEHGKRYFITFSFCEMRSSDHTHFGAEADVQFNRDGHVVSMTVLTSDKSLAEVEAFVEDMWIKMKFDYYENWDGGDKVQA